MGSQSRFIKGMDLWEEGVMGAGVIFMSVLLFGNVIGRAFGHSIIAAEEFAFLAKLVITFFGVSYATRKGRHIRMGAILELGSWKVKKIMVFSEGIIGGGLMLYLCFLAIQYTINLIVLERITIALLWPYWIFSIWVVLGMMLGSIHYLRTFIKNVKEREVWLSPEVKGEYI